MRRTHGRADSATGVKVLQALREVNETLGATTFIITHNASVADMADRVIVFGDGQIRENRENANKLDPKEIAW
jgi:putative ABC transport system ATP-binding protein